MPSDASIYGLIRPTAPPADPMAQYGRAMQLKGLMGQQELQGLQMQQVRQTLAEDQATREAYSQSGGDYTKLKDLLYGKGLYKPAMAAEKAGLEATEKRGNIAHKAAQTGDITAGHLAGAMAALAKGGGSDEAVAAAESMMAPLVGPERAASVTQKLMAMQPAARLAFVVAQAGTHKTGQEALKLFFPEASMQDTGGQIQAVNKSTLPGGPAAGSVIPGTAPIAKTMTPGERATDARGWAQINQPVWDSDRGAFIPRPAAGGGRGGAVPAGAPSGTAAPAPDVGATAGAPIVPQNLPGKWVNDIDAGIQVNTATGEARPIKLGGKPIDTKDARQKATDTKKAVDMYVASRNGLLSGLEGSFTGPIVGRSMAYTAKQQIAEGGVAAMAPVLKQLFRVSGEGTFTDKDQELLLDMVPTRKDEPEARAAKIDNIDKIIAAKLGMPIPARAGAASAAPDPRKAVPDSPTNSPRGSGIDPRKLSDAELKRELGI